MEREDSGDRVDEDNEISGDDDLIVDEDDA